MKLYGLKYHVPSRGLMQNNTWRIYENVDLISKDNNFNGMQGTGITYVDSVRTVGVESWTGEDQFRIGYSLLVEGELSYAKDPESGRRMGVIHKPGEKHPYEPWEE